MKLAKWNNSAISLTPCNVQKQTHSFKRSCGLRAREGLSVVGRGSHWLPAACVCLFCLASSSAGRLQFSAGLSDVGLLGSVDPSFCWIIGGGSWVFLRCTRSRRYVPPSDVATVYDRWPCLSTTNALRHSSSSGRSGLIRTALPFSKGLRYFVERLWYHFCLCWRSISLARSSAGLLACGCRSWFIVGRWVFVLRLIRRWAGFDPTPCVAMFL